MPKSLENSYVECDNRLQKIFYLMKLLYSFREQKVIVFFNTCHSVSFYHKIINRYIGDSKS